MSQAVGPLENGQISDHGNFAGHWLSSGNGNPPGGSPWLVYIKETDIVGGLSPVDLFVLVDEHPNSINDAAFAVQMPINQSQTGFVDTPAKTHGGACGFAFADGHSEIHKWLNPGVIGPTVNAADTPGYNLGGSGYPVANDVDIIWLAHHTSALASGAPGGIYQP